jgi:Tfp pilus assembly protein PilW
LVELLFTVGISTIVALAILGFSIYTTRTFACLYNYTELEGQSRNALDTMTKEIRQTGLLTDFSSNNLTFKDSGGGILTYRYSPTDRTLSREKSGQTNVLLRECDSLSFGIYQRNTTNGTYDQYPTTLLASNTKLVQLSWICSRKITGTRINTECVQTAKIVIRNQ